MFCDFCNTAQATVHLTEIIDGEIRELHLCQDCADEKGIDTGGQFGLPDLLAGLTDFAPSAQASPPRKPVEPCSKCGMTYDEFRNAGQFGCDACYKAFQPLIAPMLKRIHGSTQHVGRMRPEREGRSTTSPRQQLVDLRDQLKHAIENEAFEEAAVLRDKVHALEAQIQQKKESSES